MIKVYIASLNSRLDDYPSEYSLSSMRLAAYIKNQQDLSGLELKLIPLNLDNSVDDMAQEFIDRDADVVCFSAYMWTSQKIKEIAGILAEKSSKTLVIVGGPETSTFDYSFWPENTLFVLGEGEKPLHWILSKKMQNPDFMNWNPESMHISVFSKHKDRSKAVRQMEKDLAVGVPIYSEKFLTALENPKKLSTTFTWHDTAVGCPYNCGYCGHKTRPKVVFRKDDIVEEEIKRIGDLGFKNVFIIDPILGGLPGRDNTILQWYNQYAPDTAISAYYRPEYFNDKTISLLSNSNIKEILIGLQSTNPNIPEWLRSNNLEKVKKYLPQLSKNGIFSRIELITGMPGDTFDGQRESLKFVVEEIQPMSIWAYHLTVIPSTRLYGILDADQKGEELWVHANSGDSRASEANSYTAIEMDKMLVYAGAITSLYNTLKANHKEIVKNQPITINQLDQIIKPVIQSNDEQTIQYFRSSNMNKAMSFWEHNL